MHIIKVAGGTSIIKKTLASFKTSARHTVLIDMFGYDGFPGLACLEECKTLPNRII